MDDNIAHTWFIYPLIFFSTFQGTYVYYTNVLKVNKLVSNIIRVDFVGDILVCKTKSALWEKVRQVFDLLPALSMNAIYKFIALNRQVPYARINQMMIIYKPRTAVSLSIANLKAGERYQGYPAATS